jgi:hypothetical protein
MKGGVDLVVDAGEALVGPGVGVDVHGDAEAMQRGVGGVGVVGVEVLVVDAGAQHVARDRAVGHAAQLVDEGARRVLPGRDAAVAGQEVEGDPHAMVGQRLEVAIVEGLVGRADALVHRPVVELDHAAVGRVVDVLRAVGDDLGGAMIEAGEASDHIGGSVVEVDLHCCLPVTRR